MKDEKVFTVSEVIDYLTDGDKEEAAKLFEVSLQAIYHWVWHGMPRSRKCEVELLTDGKIRHYNIIKDEEG